MYSQATAYTLLDRKGAPGKARLDELLTEAIVRLRSIELRSTDVATGEMAATPGPVAG